METSRGIGCGFFTTLPTSHGNLRIKDYSIQWEVHGYGPKKIVCIMGLVSSMGGMECIKFIVLQDGIPL